MIPKDTHQLLVHFTHQPIRFFVKQAPGYSQVAFVSQFGVVNIVAADAATAGDVVLHQAQSFGLLWGKAVPQGGTLTATDRSNGPGAVFTVTLSAPSEESN